MILVHVGWIENLFSTKFDCHADHIRTLSCDKPGNAAPKLSASPLAKTKLMRSYCSSSLVSCVRRLATYLGLRQPVRGPRKNVNCNVMHWKIVHTTYQNSTSSLNKVRLHRSTLGISLLKISHQSPEFAGFLQQTVQKLLHRLLGLAWQGTWTDISYKTMVMFMFLNCYMIYFDAAILLYNILLGLHVLRFLGFATGILWLSIHCTFSFCMCFQAIKACSDCGSLGSLTELMQYIKAYSEFNIFSIKHRFRPNMFEDDKFISPPTWHVSFWSLPGSPLLGADPFPWWPRRTLRQSHTGFSCTWEKKVWSMTLKWHSGLTWVSFFASHAFFAPAMRSLRWRDRVWYIIKAVYTDLWFHHINV